MPDRLDNVSRGTVHADRRRAFRVEMTHRPEPLAALVPGVDIDQLLVLSSQRLLSTLEQQKTAVLMLFSVT